MILVDTSIWIDHLRATDAELARLLTLERVVMHPHVLGELALGDLRDREPRLARLQRLPQAPLARDAHVQELISNTKLFGTGIGYSDAHILASTRLLPGAHLWTRDKRLHAQAERLGVAYASDRQA